jgi:hypothetical protein
MPVKYRRVPLEGDYEGWWVEVRTNAPLASFLALTRLSEESGLEAYEALLATMPRLVVNWDVADEEGEPLPCNAEGFQRVPGDLLLQIIRLASSALTETGTVPKAPDANSGAT